MKLHNSEVLTFFCILTKISWNQDLKAATSTRSRITPIKYFCFSPIGDWDKCYKTMSQFVKSSEPYFSSCSSDDPGCPDAGIKMPPIPLEHTDFYGFSEFWYTSGTIFFSWNWYFLYEFFREIDLLYIWFFRRCGSYGWFILIWEFFQCFQSKFFFILLCRWRTLQK